MKNKMKLLVIPVLLAFSSINVKAAVFPTVHTKWDCIEQREEMKKICTLTLEAKDDNGDSSQNPPNYVITEYKGQLTNLQNLNYQSVEKLNNWNYSLSGGDEVTGIFTITPPNGPYVLKRGESIDVLKFTFTTTQDPSGCNVSWKAVDMTGEVPKCKSVADKYYDPDGNEVDETTMEKACNPHCDYIDNKYYNNDGHEVDQTTYEKECNPKCKKVGSTYYGQNGNVIDENQYNSECNPKCEMKDNRYFDNTGKEVIKDDFDKACNPKCEMKNDKYYDNNGHEVDKNTYDAACNPKCEMKDDKYYDDNGHEVDKDAYNQACNPKCTIKDGKYYDNEGNEVKEEEYYKKCPKKCTEENDHYFDNNGDLVTKEQYLERCGLVENPKTGAIVPLITVLVGVGSLGFIYYKTKNKKLYKL